MRLCCSLVLFVLTACGPVNPRAIIPRDAGTPPVQFTDGAEQPRRDGNSASRRDAGAPAGVDAGTDPTSDGGSQPDAQEDPNPEPMPSAVDYAGQGAIPWNESSASHEASGDCTMTYVHFEPRAPVSEGTVIFLHGFARGRSQFLEWGRHLASWGYRALVSDLCHATFAGVDPVAGGEAVADLIDALGLDEVVVTGHSAGSMAALVAGAQNNAVVAVLGLDPVAPREGDLRPQARALTGKLGALYGDPGQCNNENSGHTLYDLGQANTLSLPQATHCDFESPSNGLCTLACGGSGGDAVITTVRRLATSFIAWKLGSAGAQAWWTPGQAPYQALLQSGAIRP